MSPLQVNQNPYRWDWICCEADHGSSSSTTITSSSYVSLSDDMSDFPIDRDIEMGAPSTSSSTSGSAAWKAAFPPIIRNASELTAVDVPIDVIPCEDEACSAPVLCCEDEECQAIEKEGGGKVRQMTMLDPNLNPAALARRAHEQSCSQCHPIASHADMTPPACCDPTCLSQQEEGRGIVAMTGAKQMTAQETSGNIGGQTELGMYQCTDEECKILAAYLACCGPGFSVNGPCDSHTELPQQHKHGHQHSHQHQGAYPETDVYGHLGEINNRPRHHFDQTVGPVHQLQSNGSNSQSQDTLRQRRPQAAPSNFSNTNPPPSSQTSTVHPSPGLTSPPNTSTSPSAAEEDDLNQPKWSTKQVHALLESLSGSSGSQNAAINAGGKQTATEHLITADPHHQEIHSEMTIRQSLPVAQPHICHWQNCHMRFDTVEKLLHHVGTDHLSVDQVMVPTTPVPISQQSSHSIPPMTAQDVMQQDIWVQGNGMQQDITTFGDQNPDASMSDLLGGGSLMSCLWDDCLPSALTPVTGTSHQLQHAHSHDDGLFAASQLKNHARETQLDSTEALFRHLLDAHLAATAADLAAGTTAWPDIASNMASHLATVPHTHPSTNHTHNHQISNQNPFRQIPSSSSPSSALISTKQPQAGPSEPKLHYCRWAGCSSVFTDDGALQNHLSEEHVGSNKSQYECLWAGCEKCEEDDCLDCKIGGEEKCLRGRQFASRQKIMRHLQSHTGYRPFICSLCKQSFSEQATLSAHLRRHANEKPFKCDHPGCNKAFSVMASLTIHKRVHEQDKKHKCPHCDKGFVEVSNLTKHIRTHSGEKPFPCTHRGCNKKFTRPDQMKRHLLTHSKETTSTSRESTTSEGSDEGLLKMEE